MDLPLRIALDVLSLTLAARADEMGRRAKSPTRTAPGRDDRRARSEGRADLARELRQAAASLRAWMHSHEDTAVVLTAGEVGQLAALAANYGTAAQHLRASPSVLTSDDPVVRRIMGMLPRR